MMSSHLITTLKKGDETALEAFLKPRLAESLFLIGNMRAAGFVDKGERYQGTYVVAFEGRKIAGVVAHYWNGSLVLQAPRYLVELVTKALTNADRPLMRILGPHDQVEAAKALLNIAPRSVQLDSKEHLFSLKLADLKVPVALSSGKMYGRPIRPEDIDLVTAWRVAYQVELLAERDTPALRQQTRKRIAQEVGEARTWLLDTEGQTVAMTGFNVAMAEVVQVGGVFTPPALRRRGYGRAVVAASLLAVRSEGVEQGVLFTQENNIAAQKAYTALGFLRVGTYHLLILKNPLGYF